MHNSASFCFMMQEDVDYLLGKMEDTEDVAFNIQELIIKTRLDFEKDFREGKKKKSFLWSKIHSKILEVKPDFEMTREQVCRKYLNFQTTYKRIKRRHNETGRKRTSWEFFDMFDEVYGTDSSIISPPITNSQSPFHTIPEVQDVKQEVFIMNDSTCSFDNLAEENCFPNIQQQDIKEENETYSQSPLHIISDVQDVTQEFLTMNDSICSSENLANENSFHKKKRQKMREESEMLGFLKKEAERDEERHKEIIELERSKVELEKERVKVLTDLKIILQKVLEK